jgi:hypothetical protein
MTLRRLKRKIIRLFFREQWSLLVCDSGGNILTHLVPPRDVIWADPFPVEAGDRTYIFLEQQSAFNNGVLGYIELFPGLSHSDFIPVLEKDYHLSFPNVFSVEQDNQKIWYMIPESHKNKTIDLYRARRFPDTWEHETTLLSNITAVDSTVFRRGSLWWLFTSVGSETEPVNRNLSAFYGDCFPTQNWRPHPMNPLSRDPGNSRMAGAVFVDPGGSLNRPAQDCAGEYGKKIHINRIMELDQNTYREVTVETILPEKRLRAVCTHTINYSRRYTLRDIKTRTFKLAIRRER